MTNEEFRGCILNKKRNEERIAFWTSVLIFGILGVFSIVGALWLYTLLHFARKFW